METFTYTQKKLERAYLRPIDEEWSCDYYCINKDDLPFFSVYIGYRNALFVLPERNILVKREKFKLIDNDHYNIYDCTTLEAIGKFEFPNFINLSDQCWIYLNDHSVYCFEAKSGQRRRWYDFFTPYPLIHEMHNYNEGIVTYKSGIIEVTGLNDPLPIACGLFVLSEIYRLRDSS